MVRVLNTRTNRYEVPASVPTTKKLWQSIQELQQRVTELEVALKAK